MSSFPTVVAGAAGHDLASAIHAWQRCLGAGNVLLADAATARYGSSTAGIERSIPAALRPASADEIVSVVDIARDHAIPLYPISTGNNWGYGDAHPSADGCVVVDLSGLDRIVDMEPELGLVSIEPGVTQAMLKRYLDAHRLPFLVPTTGAGPNCSILGNALERGYGITPLTDHFAAVTALEAVMPDGRIYRSAMRELGGTIADRAFKWGMGPYIDGLFAQGNLGIVTQITIALARRPERIEAFLFTIADERDLAAAVRAVRQILRDVGGAAGAINLMNARRILAMVEPYPRGRVAGGGCLPAGVIAELAARNAIGCWTGLGSLYGTTAAVGVARRRIRQVLAPVAKRVKFVTPDSAGHLHRLLQATPFLRRGRTTRRAAALARSLRLIAGEPSQMALPLAYWRSETRPDLDAEMDPARDGCGLLWYSPVVPMLPDRVARFVELTTQICSDHAIEPLITLTSLSDRCFDSSVPLLFAPEVAGEAERAHACYRALLEQGCREGFVPYRVGIHAMADVVRPGTPFWDVAGAIKAALDPRQIISPGRYAPAGYRQREPRLRSA